MTVRVKLFATLQEIAGVNEIYIEADDVMSVLEQLVQKFSKLKGEIFEDYEARKVRPRVKVMVNGYNIDHLRGFDTRLVDGDRVAVFPVLAGG
ncbi:MAG: MoaD family protein [Methanomassiliicoccales archaeon]|nr:MoaD family protein [Methanomassiliicoccales archaeon]